MLRTRSLLAIVCTCFASCGKDQLDNLSLLSGNSGKYWDLVMTNNEKLPNIGNGFYFEKDRFYSYLINGTCITPYVYGTTHLPPPNDVEDSFLQYNLVNDSVIHADTDLLRIVKITTDSLLLMSSNKANTFIYVKVSSKDICPK